jgi:hypothetical protein
MANKKINQLVSKTAILSTDIFGIGDATTGQLFKKTIAELQAAIGGAVISVNGLVGTVVLDTDDIQELATPTNKYFTDARARGAISLTVTGNSGASTYSSGTGVLNVPTYTLAGLGGISATFLSGTSGISYNSTTGVISYSGTVYTDASIRALLSGSTGISYNSTTGAISYSGTVYTDASVRALISMTTTGTSGASTYNNTTGVINVPNYTLAGLGGISLTSLSGGTGITYNNTTGAISYSGTVYTDASVRALISAGTGISYNNTTGVITYSGTVYTDASIRALISLTTTGTSGASTYNSTTGVLNIPQYQAVLTNPVTGTGTSGHVAYWNGSGSIAGSANHFWDNTNGRLGIGTSSPGAPLSVVGNSSGYTLYSIGRNNADNASVISFRSNSAATEYAWIESGVNSQLDFGTNGNYRMRITSAGNVGIGTSTVTSSAGWTPTLVLNATSAALIIKGINGQENSFGSSDSLYIDCLGSSTASNNNIIFRTSNTNSNFSASERMRITSAGALSIGMTTAPYGRVNIKSNSSTVYAGFGIYAAGNENFTLLNHDGNVGWIGCDSTATGFATPLAFWINSAERMRIHNNGNVTIGTASDPGYRLYVNGAIYATSNITANSDIRLKKNLEIINNPTDKLMELNGYSYQWKSDDSHQYGVIAQEVEKILPYAVSTGNDGIKGVSYNQIIPVLIEAVKEQKAKIENLEILLASK